MVWLGNYRIKDIQVAKEASINLSKIGMKGTKLAQKFIGDVSEITKKDQGVFLS